ncbi:Pre-mRNA-splicing factor CWC25 [Termitomyces sp. J132]|nr:Pre-mRNA-splicing factor CWC25 [Termitomyces sp. J132]
MGGGDLNMKKSWHPLLLKNQERVWLEEKKALEEKKKLDQLRKEKEEERQLQELQRLQEEQTGKKRTEKLEWMYATPATGSSQNPDDLEDYLLGKKRVDKILTADENAKIGASHKNFIAVQNANNVRDIAAKIREDPLLAIKQQEQAALQALMSNPLRLREMQERNGITSKKSKEEKRREKEERRRLKHERKHRHSPDDRKSERRHSSPSHSSHRRRTPSPSRRSRSPIPASLYHDYERRRYQESSQRGRRNSPDYRHRDRSPALMNRHRGDERPMWPRSDESDDTGKNPPRLHDPSDDRAARLAAMSSNAVALSAEREVRLAALQEKERAELVADDAARVKSKGMASFLSSEQKKVFGGPGGLEDRIRRGRGALVGNID